MGGDITVPLLRVDGNGTNLDPIKDPGSLDRA
jgi:hypothetical protein